MDLTIEQFEIDDSISSIAKEAIFSKEDYQNFSSHTGNL